MEIRKDFSALLGLFNERHVEYLIVGAFALAWHGCPRYTGDIDLFVDASPANAVKILEALDAFGFGSVGLRLEDFQKPDNVIQLGVAPVRIDILTSISGVSFKEALEGSVAGNYGDIPVRFLGKREYIINKTASGRLKDLADVESISGLPDNDDCP